MENTNKFILNRLAHIADSINNDQRLNEKYLHQYFSGILQTELSAINLMEFKSNSVYPDWPTVDDTCGVQFSKYLFDQKKKKFFKNKVGKAGIIDFAIGQYSSPETAIEFSLNFGWENETIVFDFLKLLDPDNPFKNVYSLNIILRKKDIAKGQDYHSLLRKLNKTIKTVQERLTTHIDPTRNYYFIVTEVSSLRNNYNANFRKHWYKTQNFDSWIEGENIEELITLGKQNSQLRLF